MSFKIAIHPTRAARLESYGWTPIQIINEYANHKDIIKYLEVARNIKTGEPAAVKLPMDMMRLIQVPLAGRHNGKHTSLMVTTGHKSDNGMRGKSSKHRCFAQCPDCQKFVPAGRTNQHKCK